MPAGLWTGEGLLLHRCPQLRWLQVHGYSAWKDPRCPGAAIHEGIPGVVAGMICLGAFLPTGCYRTFYGRIGCFDIIGQICIHVVRSGGFGIESELLMELAEHIIHDRLFVFHGEHPDTEILGLVLLTELCAGQSNRDSAISSPYFS